MRKLIIPLMLLVVVMFMPYDSFAQSEPDAPELTFVQRDITSLELSDIEVVGIDNFHVSDQVDTLQVSFDGGKIVFDKDTGASTIFNENEIVIKSDSYVVRGAEINTDAWSNLLVNDEPTTYTIEETDYNAIITFTKESLEGKFDVETIVSNNFSKTTAKFTNYIYNNHKFSFTETLDLNDNILNLNSQDIDLNNYIGQTFPREILEQNMDLVLEAKEVYFNAGLGFEYLWSVTIHDDTKVSLDWANVGETHTPIGETVELDPTYNWGVAVNGNNSHGLAVDSTGDVLVIAGNWQGHWYEPTSTGLNAKGSMAYSNPYALRSPTGVEYHLTDNTKVYLANTKYDQLNEFQLSISSSGVRSYSGTNWSSAGMNNPAGIDMDSHGNIWVADRSNQNIKYFVPSYSTQNQINFSTYYPSYIGVDGNDDVWVNQASPTSGIKKYSVSGSSGSYSGYTTATASSTFITGTFQTIGIDKAKDMIYAVPNATRDTLNVYDLNGTFQYSFVVSSGNDIQALEVDEANNLLYVLTLDSQLHQLTLTTPPDPITGFTASQNILSPTQVDLAWDIPSANPAVSSYNVYTHNTATGVYTSIASPTTNSFTHTGVSAGTTINYVVDAVNSVGNSGYSNIIPVETYYKPNQVLNVSDQGAGIPLIIDWDDATVDGVAGLVPSWTGYGWYSFSGFQCNVVAGECTKNNSGGWNNYARSDQTVNPTTGGGIVEWTRNADLSIMGFGQGTQSNSSTDNNVDFGIYSQYNDFRVYEQGTQKFVASNVIPYPIDPNDVFKVTMDGNGLVEYYFNDAKLYTSTTTASGDYYADLTINSAGGSAQVHFLEAGTLPSPIIASYDIVRDSQLLDTIDRPTTSASVSVSDYSLFAVAADMNGGSNFMDSAPANDWWVITGGSGYTKQMGAQFDLSSMSGLTITGADFDGNTRSMASGSNCDAVPMNNSPQYYLGTNDPIAMKSDIQGQSTKYIDDTNACNGSNQNHHPFTDTFNSNGVTAIQNAINGNGEFYFGFKYTGTSGGIDRGFYGANGNNVTPTITVYFDVPDPNATLPSTYTDSTAVGPVVYEISATNAVGTGTASAPHSATAGAPPVAPTNLAATTSDPIILTWTASPDPIAASPVLHYSMERSTDGTNWSTLSANMGNVVTYTDNTTTAGTIYHYKVTAHTNAGAGPASTPTSASAGTVSSAPQTLAVTQTIPAQLDTTWAAPADDGSTGGITGYKVYRDGAVKATLGNVLSYNDATIAAGTQYTYTVTALNAAGESAVSNGIVITSWAVPDAPTGATASGGIPIVVSWNAPNSDRPITDYKVYRDGSLLTTVSAPTLTYSDSNVTPNTTYAYTISAVSAVGEGAQSGSTNGQSGVPPAQITTFTATPVDSSRIKLDWAAPNDNGYPITSYKIYQGGNHVGTTAGLTYTDTGLQNNTLYSYTVTAVNIGGEGTQSAAQTATTSTPLTPPTNVYTEEHITSVNVTWDKVIGAINYTVERNGVTLGTTTDFWFIDSTASASTSYVYKVYANSSAVNGLVGTTSTVITASLTPHQYITVTPTAPSANAYPIDMYELHRNGAMVGYLEPNNLVYEDHDVAIGTTYTYQVRAHNLLGWSQLSPVGSVTTWNVPDIITTLAGNTGSPIILTWTAPNTDKPITLYTIYRDGNLLATTTTPTYSDATVAAGTTYVYTATATSVIGEGIQSAGLSLQAGTVPTVPQNAVVTAQSGNNISFNWTAPSNNGGVPITGYNPQVSTDNGTTWTDLLTVPTTATSFSHTGLTTGQNYSYQVLAINVVGNSPYTAVISTIAGDVPAQVTGLGTTAISDTAIDLTWNVPANNAYSISNYNVLRSVDGTTWTTLTSATNSYSDTGLTADTIYHYKVSAINTLGTGAESATAQQRTFGLPDPIATITLTPQSTTQINLSWTQPNLNGFPLVAYTVQQSTDSGATWTTLATQTSTTYSAIALTQNTIYDYRVNTENSFGNTDGTANTATTYPIATNVISGTTQSDTEIQVTWNAIAGNGAVQYSLEKSTDSGVTWTPLSIYLTSTTYTDTGLTPLTNYNYRVASVNSAGLSSPSISSNTVTTFGPSDVPTNLALTALINAEIQLDWVAPTITNGAPVTSYNIERSTNGSTWSVLVNNVVGLTHTDTGLTTSQVYHYKVSANNIYGTSAFSTSANAMASDVPSQVTGLAATTLPNYEIQLDWTAPNANGYSITGYTIERSTDAGTTWNVLVADTQNTNVTYTDINLTVSQTYYYKISAINQVGTGPVSASANAQAGDIPDATILTATPTTSGQIILSWTVPNDNGFTNTKYLIERSTDGITYTPVASIVPSTGVTTHTDTGSVGTLYYYKVTTENAIGFSPDSNVESLNAGDVPGVVTNLAGTTQSDTQVNLTWTAAAPNGYPVTGHKIEQSLDNVTWNVIVADTQTAQTSHTVSSLTEKTDYYYRVSAINTIGTGSLSNTIQLHTFGPPEAISTVSSTATNISVTLSWTAPFDHGSAITGYKVEVQDFNTGNWLNLATVTTPTYTQINMIPSTQYEYRVTTINPYGTSYSPNTVVSTLANTPGTPTVTVTSGTELKVEWAAVAGTGITYTVYTSSDDITYTAGPVGHPTAYYDHQGLTNGQTVYYKVTVLNSSGESAQSPSAVGTTYTTPDAPTNIQITHTTPLSATITWTAPANDGGDPSNLSYTLQRSNDNANWMSLQATTTLTATDSPLSPATQYYWRVNSVNSVGIGGTSGTVSYLSPDVPTAPTSLTAALTGTTNSASVLNWGTPSSTSGYSIIGYQIERNANGAGWTVLVADTSNSGTVYTNTGLTAGTNYVYRVSAITAVGIGPISNTASVQPVLAVLTIIGTPTGGNSVLITPTLSVTGTSTSTIVQQALYVDNARDVYKSISVPLTNGASLQTMTSYPTQTSNFFATITLDTGFVIQSNIVSLTPAAPFVTGDISFNEDRIEYTSSATCLAAGGLWGPPSNPLSTTLNVCTLSYTESVLDFTVQPVGAEVIISYQPQNLNEPAIVKAFTATSSQITESTDVDPETDYYGSIIVNPQFQYTVNADQTITIICDPNDIMCDDSDQDLSTPGIQGAVPKGVPAEKTFKSFKSPESTRQLGIEPMGNLFGVNMVFIFVIALAGIFTGRSAPMGVIFIVVTLGIMSFLGYLDFGDDLMNAATWSLLIIAAILGIFLGKRWS